MNDSSKEISSWSRLLLVLAAVALSISIFVPIWKIDLDAPQYPEGLGLLIYADKLGGDVEIINGLNHYIGMKTLHAEEFVEFTVLPYIIGAYAIFSLMAALAGRKKILYTLFVLFILFGIIAMFDFWRWEYEYGHNLDPTAAIIVPGMAYQPPLIGFKQLLNFGAYSIPALGGWLFIASGILMAVATIIETKFLNRFKKNTKSTLLILLTAITLSACANSGPEPIALNKDNCEFCKMTIAEGKFGCEVITAKGRVYKFDDLSCLMEYKSENATKELKSVYVSDYTKNNVLLAAENAFYINSEEINSPMGGGFAAFADEKTALEYADKLDAKMLNWKNINE